ncbi:NADH-quinone oxidoreductase chain C [Ehrlichia ruminantium]|uniref:NADH-quinone oxidoreductase subunit C n=1 Tax=Ehrlichia ruminantium TaxID=779 RepID=UPI0007C134FE|nr:NADH-quinone oxidoreductase chain C [Ehrlichia ruminantium]
MIANNIRIFCKVSLHENENITSITNIFNAAGWFEREAFDMYGILFTNNPDLRRILTDYGFFGHPMLNALPIYKYCWILYLHLYSYLKIYCITWLYIGAVF